MLHTHDMRGQSHQERAPARASRSLSILVVDDDEVAAEGMALLLRAWRHQVQVAHRGEQALGLCDSGKPDLVLLDIEMPGMSGYEVARRLRNTGCRARLIAVTAFGEPKDRSEAMAAGFDEHHLKPISPTMLRALVARA